MLESLFGLNAKLAALRNTLSDAWAGKLDALRATLSDAWAAKLDVLEARWSASRIAAFDALPGKMLIPTRSRTPGTTELRGWPPNMPIYFTTPAANAWTPLVSIMGKGALKVMTLRILAVGASLPTNNYDIRFVVDGAVAGTLSGTTANGWSETNIGIVGYFYYLNGDTNAPQVTPDPVRFAASLSVEVRVSVGVRVLWAFDVEGY